MNLRITCFFLFLILSGNNHLKAQEEFIEPPAKLLTSFPFTQLTGGIVILHAQFDSFSDTLNFILDTGSSGISLDSSTASYFGLETTPTDRTIRGIAGIRKVNFLFNRTLRLPDLNIEHLDFHINDYDILTTVYGERIDGIIGYAVLSRYIVKVDYDSLKISFFTKGTMRYPKNGYLLKPAISQLVSQPLRIRDERTIYSRFLFDLGAGLCMMLSKEFVQDSNFIMRKKKIFIKEGEGLGGKIDMELLVMKEVRIGPYKFRSVPVFVFDDEYNVSSYPYMCGILGNDLLRRFNIIINYGKGDIYITPNTHYLDVFDYAYSGIELYLVGGLIIIGDVAKGSPAEAAGIKEGDEVIAINKNISHNLNAYKIALQAPNEKIKIIVRRDGIMREFEFKIRSIK